MKNARLILACVVGNDEVDIALLATEVFVWMVVNDSANAAIPMPYDIRVRNPDT